MQYVAEVIVLNDRPVIRIRSVTARGSFLVGYFASVESINDSGRSIELADVELPDDSRPQVGRQPPGPRRHFPSPEASESNGSFGYPRSGPRGAYCGHAK
jgi:hypothetical protein